jgi:hypothetical protein
MNLKFKIKKVFKFKQITHYTGFEALTAVAMKSVPLWDLKPCSPI